jgi:hypothetical protein
MKIKLLSLLAGTLYNFRNLFDFAVRYSVYFEHRAVVLKILIFLFTFNAPCHRVTHHVNIYTNMSSVCLVASKYSDYGLLGYDIMKF